MIPVPEIEKCLQVAVEAQILSGTEGGAEQYLIGLISGLGRLSIGKEQYTIATAGDDVKWIRPYAGANTRILPAPGHMSTSAPARLVRAVRRRAGASLRGLGLITRPETKQMLEIPRSDGFYESIPADVLHITYPYHFVSSSIPTVYTVHDLQHRHLPEYFPERALSFREYMYPAAFAASRAIVAISHWVKDDLIRQYNVPAEKVYTIPSAAPMEAYSPVTKECLARARTRFRLPESFLLYPALTYRHKNHIRLMEAIALLRDRDGLRLNLICTGAQKLHWPAIESRLKELDLASQVRFLGFVRSDELRCLFHLTDLLVLPSMFEGVGIPLLEAFREGTAVACSDIPAFQEYGGDAPAFFDYRSVEQIAEVLRRICTNKEALLGLRERSRKRRDLYSWERSAAMYRAVYRKVGECALTDEDRSLLSACQQ